MPITAAYSRVKKMKKAIMPLVLLKERVPTPVKSKKRARMEVR